MRPSPKAGQATRSRNSSSAPTHGSSRVVVVAAVAAAMAGLPGAAAAPVVDGSFLAMPFEGVAWRTLLAMFVLSLLVIGSAVAGPL